MNTNAHRNLRRILTGSISAACTLAAIFATQPAHAATATWNAGTAVSIDDLWSTATNWTFDTAPLNGADLVFAGTANKTNSNDIIPLTSIASLALSNAGWDITLGTLSIGAGGVTANDTSTLGGTLTLGAAQTWSNSAGILTFGGTLDAATFGLTFDGAGDTTLSIAIANGAALTKSGAGILTLSGTNAFTSATINGGTITGGTVTLSGGATALTSSATSAVNSDVTISTAAGTITSNAGTLSFGGTLDAATFGLTFDGAGNTTLSIAIANGAALTKSGAGILTLAGTNGFTSATINGGTITGGTVTLSGGATALTSSATSAVNSNVTITTAAGTITSSAGTLSLGGTVDAGSLALTFAGAGNTDVSNAIVNGTTLTKSGAGALTLSATNTYDGGTNVNGGVLALGSSGALGTTGTISFGGGTLQFSASNTTDYSARFSPAASQAYSLDTNGQAVVLGTNLTSVGGSLTKSGAGTLTLAAANSLGSTTINGGTITGGTVTLSGGATALTSSATSAVNSAVTISTAAGTITSSAGTLTLGGTLNAGGFALTFTGAGDTTLSGAIANGAALTKSGAGTLTLSGANAYSGPTTISSGTLRLGLQTQTSTLFTDGNLGGSGNWSLNNTGSWNGDASLFGGQTSHSGADVIYIGNNGGGFASHTDANVFQPSTTYKFTIDVGTRSDVNGSSIQDRLQIGYGGTLLADSRVADLGYVAQTGWQDVTISYTTPASGAMIGQQIKII